LANEEQGTEKTEGEGDEQNVAESRVIGLDNGNVLVLPPSTTDVRAEKHSTM
jgi:hypothetical protein